MKVVSVNVALPRPAVYRDRTFMTGIFKRPVSGRVAVLGDHLDGDGQADLSVHGGHDKAVYAYPSEHYAYWNTRLDDTLAWSAFGENLTTEGLVESDVCIGDRYRFGTALLAVTQPRLPCYKLAMKLQRHDMIAMFRESGRSGFYLRVIEEGEVGPGDPITLVDRSRFDVSVTEVNRLHQTPGDRALLERVLEVAELAESQRRHFEKLAARPGNPVN